MATTRIGFGVVAYHVRISNTMLQQRRILLKSRENRKKLGLYTGESVTSSVTNPTHPHTYSNTYSPTQAYFGATNSPTPPTLSLDYRPFIGLGNRTSHPTRPHSRTDSLTEDENSSGITRHT